MQGKVEVAGTTGYQQEKPQDTGNMAGHTLRLRWGQKKLLIFVWTRPI